MSSAKSTGENIPNPARQDEQHLLVTIPIAVLISA